MKKIILGFFLIFSLIFTGCEAVGPGIIITPLAQAYITWKDGEAHKYYKIEKTIVYRAVKRAAVELNYEIEKEEEKKNYTYLVAGANDRFKIKISEIEPNVTCVSIRINFMGDKPYAEMFYKQIDEHLKIINYEDGEPANDS